MFQIVINNKEKLKMKAVMQILLGLILIVALIWLTFFSVWPSFSDMLWKSVYTVFLGGVAWLLVLVAIALIVVGFSEFNQKN
mgnify:CR=1 FL=1